MKPELILIITVALIVADFITTYRGMTKRGATELNPALGWLFDKLGILPVLILTHAAGVGISVMFYLFAPIYLLVATAFYAGLFGWNMYQLNKN